MSFYLDTETGRTVEAYQLPQFSSHTDFPDLTADPAAPQWLKDLVTNGLLFPDPDCPDNDPLDSAWILNYAPEYAPLWVGGGLAWGCYIFLETDESLLTDPAYNYPTIPWYLGCARDYFPQRYTLIENP